MTVRPAKRPLAGVVHPWRPIEIVLGRYTTAEYDRMVYMGKEAGKVDMGDAPAASVKLNGGASGVRTFIDSEEIRALIGELQEAAAWLDSQRAGDREVLENQS